jgi:sarcosine oxidase subunit gamma
MERASMVERHLRQSPLAALGLAARVNAAAAAAPVRLADRGFLGQLSVRGAGDQPFAVAVEGVLGAAPPMEPNRVAAADAVRILWLGPDEWLAVLPEERLDGAARALIQALAGQPAGIADVSEARAVIGIAGPHARDALSQGTSLDLHPRVFRPGQCAQTLVARVPVILAALDEAPSYDLYVQRSLAEYLWTWLEDAAHGYGVGVVEG